MGGPPEMLADGIGPMGYDMPAMADPMKGKGKGMMPMPMMMPEMPLGPQPPGSWQPWGKRHQPPPMILPIKYPEAVPEKSASGGESGDTGEAKGGKGGDKWGSQKWGNDRWGSNSWNNNDRWGQGKGKGKSSWGGGPI